MKISFYYLGLVNFLYILGVGGAEVQNLSNLTKTNHIGQFCPELWLVLT